MDHIPHPYNSLCPHLVVPLLGSIPTNGSAFDHLPVSAGYADEPSTREGLVFRDNLDTNDWACLIQSWLYFGVLREYADYIGLDLDISDLTAHGPNGTRNLTTTKLFSRFEGQIQSSVPGKRSQTESHSDRLIEAITSAKKWLTWFSGQSFAASEPIPLVCFSVGILLDSLDLSSIHQRHDVFRFSVDHHPTIFLINHMKSMGWCPREAYNVCVNLPPCAAYFLSLLRRQTRPGIDHESCSERLCVANNVDETTYVTRHVEDKCQCPTVGVDEEKLVQIIKEGGIPIVTVKVDENDEVTLELQPSASCSEYVTISHVWADGLGNPLANSMPRCQLVLLNKRISALPETEDHGSHLKLNRRAEIVRNTVSSPKSRPMWIDTLCIPVQANYRDVRLAAINKMAAVYAGASCSLVLDYELQQLKLGSMPAVDHLSHIFCSAWSGRCWTLQEGALSVACYFQFADGALNPVSPRDLFGLLTEFRTGRILVIPAIWRALQYIYDSLSLRMQELFRSTIQKPQMSFLYRSLFYQIEEQVDKALYSDVKSAPSIDVSHANRSDLFPYYHALIKTWNLLCQRSTTKRDDLYLILANLLDYNSYQVAKLDAETERLKAILWNCQALPLSVLFHQGPRSNPSGDHKDRWVPLNIEGEWLDEHSMLYVEGTSLIYREEVAATGKRTHPIYLLPPTKLVGNSKFLRQSKPSFDVIARRPPSDELNVDGDKFQTTALVLAQELSSGSRTIHGACIQILRIIEATDNQATRLIGIYDCPVTIQACELDSLNSAHSNVIRAQACLKEYVLELECEPVTSAQTLKRRIYTIPLFQHPLHQILVSGIWVSIFVTCYALFFSGVPAYVSPSTGLETNMLDVNFHIHERHWTWKAFLYFIYTVLYLLGLFIIGLPFLEIFNGFVIPWRGISHWDASPITKAFFLLNYSKYVLIVVTLVWDYQWCDVAYDTWVASFDEKWAQGPAVMTWKGLFWSFTNKWNNIFKRAPSK